MTPKQHISLLAFLISPREGMSRLNGWQRIWLVTTGILLALHILVGASTLSDFSTMQFDQSPFDLRLAETEKWQLDNKRRCVEVAEDMRNVKRVNDQYNADGNAKATDIRSATLAKLEELKTRLFAIETSGGKFSTEWSKYSNAIDAYTNKLSEQAWVVRPFNVDSMVRAGLLATVRDCADFEQRRITVLAEMDTAKMTSKAYRESAKSSLLITVGSFFCVALGLYFFGWCLGWIRKGFKAGR